jgi:ribosomal protein S21
MINWIQRRFKSISRIVEISPRITNALNSNFDLKFSESVEPVAPSQSSQLPHQRSFIQPGRTYREELYSSRRIELTPTQATPTAFRKLSQRLQEEQVLQRVKERRYFVRPGLIKHAITYAGRRKKFNQLVKSTINRIVDHKESQK